VVALIALVVAAVQLLQAIFGTAEGYGRCRPEVIGAWAAKTWAKFLWRELRYETRYITPEIDLLSPQQLREKRSHGITIGPHKVPKGPYYLVTDRPEYATSEIRRMIEDQLPKDGGHEESDNDRFVSWIPLLQTLHGLQDDVKRVEASGISTIMAMRIGDRGRKAEATGDQSPSEKAMSNTGLCRVEVCSRTDIVIKYREYSWDFMPAAVVRPLAKTYLGPLIIMARRLGMRWQQLDTSRLEITATGNGYNFSFTSIRGLGVVVQFSTEPGARASSALIPSELVDKMVCGILPCSDSANLLGKGQKDYNLIGDDRKVTVRNVIDDLRVPENVLKELGDPGLQRRMAWWDGNFRRPAFNDALILICPFLALEESGCNVVQFVGWLGMQPCSVFEYKEAKVTLLSKLSKCMSDLSRPLRSASNTATVHDFFVDMEKGFPGRFYNRRHAGGNPKVQSSLVKQCRAAYDATTIYFEALQSPEWNAGEPKHPPVKYKDLVGAHCSMALKAGLYTREQTGNTHKIPSLYKDTFGAWPAPNSTSGPKNDMPAKSLCDVAWCYTTHLGDFFEDVRARSDCGTNEVLHTDRDLEEACWMLMLRGLSCVMPVRYSVEEEIVPSSFYSNRTLIWIT